MDGSQMHTPEARRKKAATIAESVLKKVAKATKGMNPTQEAMIRDRALEMPKRCVETYLRAVRGKSRPAAIKALCMECCGWQRREVALCTALACPLFLYRPFKE